MKVFIISILLIFMIKVQAAPLAVDTVINNLQSLGNYSADKLRGKTMWLTLYSSSSKPYLRSCSSCHTNNLSQTGKHVMTGRKIAALAPSNNRKSLTRIKKIKKWMKRNCLWTLGRECSTQEKIDLLTFIKHQ